MSFKSALVMRAAEISNNYNSYIKIFSVAKNDWVESYKRQKQTNTLANALFLYFIYKLFKNSVHYSLLTNIRKDMTHKEIIVTYWPKFDTPENPACKKKQKKPQKRQTYQPPLYVMPSLGRQESNIRV